ncbi:TPA: diphthine--ammonia ligase [Candidatus Micrarchaeota archaeon]|nr:diphthine--ammonia ligase [Candidatus Micrarchaeota archaeon]
MTLHVACLFSGGKDSCYAAGWALSQGWTVTLVTMNPEPYSMMFHHPNVQWTKLQAETMGVKQMTVSTKHETELNDLENALRKLKIEGIVTGAVASVYQKDRIEAIGKRLGVSVHSPLWHSDEKKLNELLDTMEIYVIAVAAEGLGKEFLGKPLRKLVDAKVKNIHPFLEGGEGETFVTNAPFFKKRIEINGWKISWDGVRGVAEIEDAGIVKK